MKLILPGKSASLTPNSWDILKFMKLILLITFTSETFFPATEHISPNVKGNQVFMWSSRRENYLNKQLWSTMSNFCREWSQKTFRIAFLVRVITSLAMIFFGTFHVDTGCKLNILGGSGNVLDLFWMSYLRSIYVSCLRG